MLQALMTLLMAEKLDLPRGIGDEPRKGAETTEA